MPKKTANGISEVELDRLENSGWWTNGRPPSLARMMELAAADKPTLAVRFTDEFEVPSGSRAAHIKDFFANDAWTGGRHRLLIVQAGMQAMCARAMDVYLAATMLGRLRQFAPTMPSTVDEVWTTMIQGDPRSLARYLDRLPSVPSQESFMPENGWPGAGASMDPTGNVRIHMPMQWIVKPLIETLEDTTTAAQFNQGTRRNPWMLLGATMVAFNNAVGNYSVPDEVRENVRRALFGDEPEGGSMDAPFINMRSRSDIHIACLALGLVGPNARAPYRKLERIGGDLMRKDSSDLTNLLEWCTANRTKRARFPFSIAAGALKDREILGAMFDSFDAIELFLSIMPMGLDNRAEGAYIADGRKSVDVEARISACVRLPKALAQYISQDETPNLESVSLWASQGYDYMAVKGAQKPGPHPDTAEQVRKFQDVIKPAKSTSEDEICVAPTGWLAYLPEISLPEFEQNIAAIKELSTVTVGGVDMYDPELVDMLSVVPLQYGRTPAQSYESLTDESKEMVAGIFEQANAGLQVENLDPAPKDPPRNTILYTNWNLGIVTWTTDNGDLRFRDVTSWWPARAQHLMRFIRTHDFTSLEAGNRTFPAQMEYICQHFGISTQISDYFRPEDASVFVPASERGKLPGDRGSGMDLIELPVQRRGSQAGELDLNKLYGTNIANMGVAVQRIFSYMSILRNELAANAELADQWTGDDDRYEMAKLLPALQEALDQSGTREWSAQFELEVPGTDITLPSPFRFIRRIMEEIQRASGGDYRSLMGGDRPFMGGLSLVIGLIIGMTRYTTFREIVDGDREERGEYFNQHELDPNHPVEPIPNIGKDAYLIPHQAKYDQRFSRDPEKQIMAVDTGGGKTIMGAVQRGIRTLAKGGKVLIICPNSLVTNYIEDVAMMTDGKVNVFCIDRVVFQHYAPAAPGKKRYVDAYGTLQELFDRINDAPPNTIFVMGMYTLSAGETTSFYYSGAEITKSDVVELMRQIDWQLIIVDESHKIKNPSSNAYRNLASMFRDTPQLVQMTGTYITDTVMDVLNQSKLMEPGLFGQEADFLQQYYNNVGRTRMPKTNAAPMAMKKLEDVTDLVQVRRVEWAAWLPERVDEFEPCDDLTEAQFLAYESIFDSEVGQGGDSTVDDDDLDEVQGDRMATDDALGYSLSRLERFLTAMDLDHSLPKDLKLKGDDRISPKIHKIVEILDRHFAEEGAGKVLIFTQWRDTATSIANWIGRLRPKYKDRTMHYLAEKKSQQLPLIKGRDSGIDIVVGVQKSLQEGHNLQVASRIIMVETPWSPGDLTQAEGRIFRPEPKRDDGTRGKAYFTVLLINDTVDMVKAARLVSKRLHAARGNNRDNPEYAAINKNFGIIKMGKRMLRAVRTWSDVPPAPSLARDEEFGSEREEYYSLAEYLSYVGIAAPGSQPVRNNLLEIERREIELIREQGKGEPVPIPDGGTMKGSQMLSNMPYMPNMHLPFESDLCLRNIAQWAAEELYVDEGSIPKEQLIDKLVHTEFGDGIIKRYGTGGKYRSSSLTIQLADGSKVRVQPVSAVFFITDPECLGGKSVRVKMAELAGLKLAPGGHRALRKSIVDFLQDDEPEPEEEYEDEDTLVDEEDEEVYEEELLEDLDEEPGEEPVGDDEDLSPDEGAPHGYIIDSEGYKAPVYKLKAEVASINGQFAIFTYAQPDGAPQIEEEYDDGTLATIIDSYFFVEISNRRRFDDVYDTLWDAHENKRRNFELSKESLEMLNELDQKFQQDPNARRLVWNFGAAEQVAARQFHLEATRRVRGKAIHIWPVVWRDVVTSKGSMKLRSRVYLMAHEKTQQQARNLLRLAGRYKWKRDSTGFTIRFYKNKQAAVDDLQGIAEADNIELLNFDEVREALQNLRVRRGAGRARGRR